jgi:hypothetical protein
VEQVIRDSDIVMEIGRATGGRTFVRVVHEPTNFSRRVTGLGARSVNDVAAELVACIVGELQNLGWVHESEARARRANS